ncbi:MAG: polysaccharide deacetylase family protein [Suipraeoptans sp.]
MSKSINYKERNLRAYKKRKTRARRRKVIAFTWLVVVAIVLIFIICIKNIKHPEITITAEAKEMILGDEIPELTVKVSDKDITDKKLENPDDSDYTYEKLLNNINNKKDYKITTEATGESVEGEYKIKVELDSKLTEKLEKEWKKKVRIEVKNAVLTIKNPIGEWSGEHFEKYDGELLLNSFLTYQNKVYYLNEEGKKITGFSKIGEDFYYFNDDGIRQNGWKEIEGDTYYFQDGGNAYKGFAYIDDNMYLFNSEGKMQTGEMKEGSILYKTDDDGKIVSAEAQGIDPNKPMVALTYDDGPGDRTEELLNTLEQFGAKATFFMLGNRITGREGTVKRMYDLGCELGNHSYDHPQLTNLSPDQIQAQINSTNNLITNASGGHSATVIRPPYGAIDDTVKQYVNLPMILWNVDTLDWKTKKLQATVDEVMRTIQDGNIILMHDIHGSTVDASKILIPRLIEQGYQLVTVTEMATAKGISLVAGEKYTNF